MTRYKFIKISLLTIVINCIGQIVLCQKEITYAQKVGLMTTLIYTYTKTATYQGTGFFCNDNGKSYIVSNRHVFYPNENFPDSVVFHLKTDDLMKVKPVVWYPVNVSKEYLRKYLKLHKNKEVDVAAIVLDSLYNTFKKPWPWPAYAVTIPDSMEIDIENPEIGDNILVVGYPKGFYDEYNLIPIMKSGIISSFYRTNFNNLPYFLIDSKLFHGSSGSIVIAKYKDFFFSKGEPLMTPIKDFMFLGIFSGEPFLLGPKIETDEEISVKKEYMDLGVVWYPWVIKELK
jgi:hypothetical protein